jgi:hypothetical protein
MQRIVSDHRLGFFATVCQDGSPNLSPKGTTLVLDEDHLLFADIRSPQTVANVLRGSLVEVKVVDPFTRKGYRLKGPAAVHEPKSRVGQRGLTLLSKAGSTQIARIRTIVVVEVTEARPLVSPAYDDGTATEEEMVRRYWARFPRLHGDTPSSPRASGHRRSRPTIGGRPSGRSSSWSS